MRRPWACAGDGNISPETTTAITSNFEQNCFMEGPCGIASNRLNVRRDRFINRRVYYRALRRGDAMARGWSSGFSLRRWSSTVLDVHVRRLKPELQLQLPCQNRHRGAAEDDPILL